MTRIWQGKLKRKDLEEVYDDFAEFSLSSPSRKIRRLDADLPPILEQGEPTSTSTCNQPFQQEESSASSSDVPTASVAMHVHPFDNERALVLYKPVEMSLMLSPEPTSFSLQINPSFMDGLNHVFKPRNLDSKNKDQPEGTQNNCFAVIPWIPSQVSSASVTEGYVSGSELTLEQKEAEDDEVAFMEIEEDRQQASGGLGSEGFHQQQQQHCLNAQLLPKSSNSVMWSW
ncbi:uncharacterized protein LOC122028063 [Zingiber officinale]|uniref:Uncharacterized protein n=1 Tax=Zingiber officinale TaxID=94328 RepID=A0A8J5CGQ9_ZINOF|nr:uncharacterized protein LOC122028063 [Zingiber officinale]KAG6474269.1 hypothetical protein ZIOFF_068194 [Zingiber officinale]